MPFGFGKICLTSSGNLLFMMSQRALKLRPFFFLQEAANRGLTILFHEDPGKLFYLFIFYFFEKICNAAPLESGIYTKMKINEVVENESNLGPLY